MEGGPSVSRGVRRKRRWVHARKAALAVVGLLVLAGDIAASLYLTNAEPDDGKLYSQIARNVIAAGTFSAESQPPLTPSIIRLPGYPLFLAGVYSICGTGSDRAVHIVQGLLLFATAIFAGLLAWNWTSGGRRRRRKAACAAFLLTGLCPFLLNYTGVLLTETATTFLLAAMTLAATCALKAERKRRQILWWAVAGLAAGAAVELRPDAGLFALGLGSTLVAAALLRTRPVRAAFAEAVINGSVFSLAFVFVLAPWAIRNYRVFSQFQPLAPAHAEAPGEFVPLGYFLWLRTWITDFKYIGPMLWDLEQKRIDINSIPAWAFTNDEERGRVAALLDQYNNSDPDHPINKEEKPADDDDAGDQDSDNAKDSDNDKDGDSQDSDQSAGDSSDEDDEELDLKISPEADSQFGEIARERIKQRPFFFYVELPAIRAVMMWFDTHSEYYSFAGELFPVKDLDGETYQNLWLPLFAGLVWVYTLIAAAGLALLAFARRGGWLWALMVVLLTVPRLLFFSTLENPEPRYLVEYFLFAAVLGSIVLSRFGFRLRKGKASFTFDYAAHAGPKTQL